MPAYSTIVNTLKVLGKHSKTLIADHARDPEKNGFIVFDNVQNYLRVRDHRFGRANTMNIGLAGTYCELPGVEAGALSFSEKKAQLALNKRASLTTERLLNMLDQQHLDEVFKLHWMRVLVHYVPQLSTWKAHVSELFCGRTAKLRLDNKPTEVHPLSSCGKNETVTTELKETLLDFLGQLGVLEEQFQDKCVVAAGDGLTFQRLLEVQRYLQFHPTNIESLAHLEPVLALWHTEWTDLSRIFELFWDSPTSLDPSSLGHSAGKIGRTNMPNLKKVDYYPSAELMYLVLEVRMLDCWSNYFQCPSGDIFGYFASLEAQNKLPDIQKLEEIAGKLHLAFSTTDAAYSALYDTTVKSPWTDMVPLGSPWTVTPNAPSDPALHILWFNPPKIFNISP
ncbi:hypothetical protein EST38_g13469 [Candolleomyces aberdarensis]|uniref:DUF6589 domain-containing protein n=1 Tax=Candolleomyces aberdarensis TaxID=2316362 RepID=A0A4Q2D1Q6_9AGAR|nr:hypothetical protein EST38_g13469 [Candolleomyces aberdarensis]